MEKLWNYIHATIFNAFKTIHNYLTIIDPFRLFFNISFVKKIYAKRGIHNPNEMLDNIVLKNEKTGLYSIWAGIQMGGLLILIEYGLFNILQAVLGKSLIQYVWEPDSPYKWIFLIGLLITPWIINNQLLWKNDKYLKYFDEFDKEPKTIKRKWTWISLGIIIGILGFFILSFRIYMKYCF